MYSGYRLKIENKIIPNSYMAKGSWNAGRPKDVIDRWVDMDGETHEYVRVGKAQISFSIREHNLEEHSEILQLINKYDDVAVEFWSDDSNSYEVGVFHIDKPIYSHLTAYNNDIQYSKTAIKMTEY